MVSIKINNEFSVVNKSELKFPTFPSDYLIHCIEVESVDFPFTYFTISWEKDQSMNQNKYNENVDNYKSNNDVQLLIYRETEKTSKKYRTKLWRVEIELSMGSIRWFIFIKNWKFTK